VRVRVWLRDNYIGHTHTLALPENIKTTHFNALKKKFVRKM
jgi:hypothetical protein